MEKEKFYLENLNEEEEESRPCSRSSSKASNHSRSRSSSLSHECRDELRKRVESSSIIRERTPPPVVHRVYERAPTPEPKIIERITVKKQPQQIIERIIERPRTPPPKIIDKEVEEPAPPPIYKTKIVKVDTVSSKNLHKSQEDLRVTFEDEMYSDSERQVDRRRAMTPQPTKSILKPTPIIKTSPIPTQIPLFKPTPVIQPQAPTIKASPVIQQQEQDLFSSFYQSFNSIGLLQPTAHLFSRYYIPPPQTQTFRRSPANFELVNTLAAAGSCSQLNNCDDSSYSYSRSEIVAQDSGIYRVTYFY